MRYLRAGADARFPRTFRGGVSVLPRERARLPRAAVALRVRDAVPGGQGNPLRDKFFLAPQMMFIKQRGRICVHHD